LNITENRSGFAKEIRLIIPLIVIAVISLSLDQVTKSVVRDRLVITRSVEVIKGFFELSYSENTGAAFGTFQGKNRFFIIINIFAIAFIFYYYTKFKQDLWIKLSLGLILGGALGNFSDRIFFGYVTDFLRFKVWFVRFFWWPNFNIADASVTVGAIMMILNISIANWKIKDR